MPELKNEFSKTAGSFVILYTNNEVSERETKKNHLQLYPPKKLGINLTRDLKGMHTETVRRWSKKLSRHKKRHAIPCSRVKTLLKYLFYPKPHIHAITTSISVTFSTETILTFAWSHKGPRRAEVTLRSEKRLVASFPLTSTHIKQLMAPQDVWNWHRNRQRREPRSKPTGPWSVSSQERT